MEARQLALVARSLDAAGFGKFHDGDGQLLEPERRRSGSRAGQVPLGRRRRAAGRTARARHSPRAAAESSLPAVSKEIVRCVVVVVLGSVFISSSDFVLIVELDILLGGLRAISCYFARSQDSNCDDCLNNSFFSSVVQVSQKRNSTSKLAIKQLDRFISYETRSLRDRWVGLQESYRKV